MVQYYLATVYWKVSSSISNIHYNNYREHACLYGCECLLYSRQQVLLFKHSGLGRKNLNGDRSWTLLRLLRASTHTSLPPLCALFFLYHGDEKFIYVAAGHSTTRRLRRKDTSTQKSMLVLGKRRNFDFQASTRNPLLEANQLRCFAD